MVFMEFLEMISRIAVLMFKDTEGEEFELVYKLEYFLDEILP